MLYFLHGDDTRKVRQKTSEMIDALLRRQSDASVYRVGIDSWNSDYVNDLLNSQGLFLPKYIVVFSFISENKDFFAELLRILSDIKKTEHVCIISEGDISAKDEEKIKKFAVKSQEFLIKTKASGASGAGSASLNFVKKDEPPTFAFAESFANRQFLKSMKYFTELLSRQIVAEEIHGILWWQMKSIKLSSSVSSAVGAGLNPFVFKKSKQLASTLWKDEEMLKQPQILDTVLNELFEMYHLAHRGESDFYTALEKLVVRWCK